METKIKIIIGIAALVVIIIFLQLYTSQPSIFSTSTGWYDCQKVENLTIQQNNIINFETNNNCEFSEEAINPKRYDEYDKITLKKIGTISPISRIFLNQLSCSDNEILKYKDTKYSLYIGENNQLYACQYNVGI